MEHPERPTVANLIRDFDSAHMWRCLMLAPTIQVYEALMRDEPVPVSALDPIWAKRFGLIA